MARSSACLDFLLLLLSSDSIAFPFYFFTFSLFFPAPWFCFSSRCSLEEKRMLPRRRCPFCRRWFHPHPRLKQRQKTCGRPDCRHKHKQKSNQEWRTENPDYFRGVLCAAKGKVRDALRLQAVLPSATSRLRAAQRGFRPKMARVAEIVACKFHKP
jgi:hypothetical protein